jgi:hypothetical protein
MQQGKLATLALALAAGIMPASAIAMSAPTQEHEHHCRVIGGEKLPAASGGAKAICAAIEQAVAARAPNVRFSAEVKVLRPSMLATTVVVNGRSLPEQKFAVMDRDLNGGSIRRFANSIATTVAKAAKP